MTKMKSLSFALILSLSLMGNLYALTVLLAKKTQQPSSYRSMDTLLNNLPAERREILQKEFAKDIEKIRDQYRESRKEREKIMHLLGADELDKKALEKQFSRINEQSLQSQKMMQRLITNTFSKLTPEERKTAMEHRLKREESKPNRF